MTTRRIEKNEEAREQRQDQLREYQARARQQQEAENEEKVRQLEEARVKAGGWVNAFFGRPLRVRPDEYK